MNGMILIGQYDSPFVRRVGIALHLYGMAYEHRPWSTFSDGDRIAAFNPLRRVPTLVLDIAEVVIDSTAILDHLDEVVGPSKALIAARGPTRRQALKVIALATGLADKAASLVYERVLHDQTSAAWVDRCISQIRGVLDALEADRAARETPFWFGASIGHPDIAVACALRFSAEAHPGVFHPARWPALAAHAALCEAMHPFQLIAQSFIPPR
jgi:glutathione S-transferase